LNRDIFGRPGSYISPGWNAPATSQQIDALQREIQRLEQQRPASQSVPNFLTGPTGRTFPVPNGAVQVPNYNKSGTLTGTMYQGGTWNGRAVDMRVMDPVPARGNAPAYPDGYVTYQNQRNQTIDPVTGRTLSNDHPDAHMPIR